MAGQQHDDVGGAAAGSSGGRGAADPAAAEGAGTYEELVLSLNASGMAALQRGDKAEALRLLTMAKGLAMPEAGGEVAGAAATAATAVKAELGQFRVWSGGEDMRVKLSGVTLNNLGCFYKAYGAVCPLCCLQWFGRIASLLTGRAGLPLLSWVVRVCRQCWAVPCGAAVLQPRAVARAGPGDIGQQQHRVHPPEPLLHSVVPEAVRPAGNHTAMRPCHRRA
jgi:hypothetical protein